MNIPSAIVRVNESWHQSCIFKNKQMQKAESEVPLKVWIKAHFVSILAFRCHDCSRKKAVSLWRQWDIRGGGQHPITDLERPADAAKFVHMWVNWRGELWENSLLKAEPELELSNTLQESDQCCNSELSAWLTLPAIKCLKLGFVIFWNLHNIQYFPMENNGHVPLLLKVLVQRHKPFLQ